MSTGKENNEQLVQKIKAGEDVTGNMAKLWQQNRNFVYLIARKYAKTETDIDDLMQEGYLGMDLMIYLQVLPFSLTLPSGSDRECRDIARTINTYISRIIFRKRFYGTRDS